MAPTVLHSGAPNRPSLRSRSWTMAAILERAGPSTPNTEHSVSNVQPSPWWLNSTPAGAAEETDLFGRDQTFPKDLEEAREGRCSCALRSPRAGCTLQRLFD